MTTALLEDAAATDGTHGGPQGWLVDSLRLIREEYLEFPGLRLTRAQAQRLWNLSPEVCDALLKALIEVKFLRLTPDGRYARYDAPDSEGDWQESARVVTRQGRTRS